MSKFWIGTIYNNVARYLLTYLYMHESFLQGIESFN